MENEDMMIATKILSLIYAFDFESRITVNEILKHMKPCDANKRLPKQEDSSSCGVFVTMIVFCFMKHQCIGKLFGQFHTNRFRKFMFYTLAHFHGCVDKESLQKKMKKDNYASLFFDKTTMSYTSIYNITESTKIPNITLVPTITADEKEKLKEWKSKTNTFQANVLKKNLIDVEMEETEEEEDTVASKTSEKTQLSGKSGRGKNISLNIVRKDTSTTIKRKLPNKKKAAPPPKKAKTKEEEDKIDDELDRLRYTALSQWICHYKAKQPRFLLSFNKQTRLKSSTNDGIPIKDQFFDLLEDFYERHLNTFDDTVIRKVKNFLKSLKPNQWTYIARGEEGKQFKSLLQDYYMELRKDHAREHKPYSHIKYDVKENKFNFLIFDRSKSIVVQDTQTQDYIYKHSFVDHSNEAKRKRGTAISLLTASKRQVLQKDSNKNFPAMTYQQGKKQICFQYSLLSAMTYLRSVYTKKRKNVPRYLRQDIFSTLIKKTVKLVGKDIIATTNILMQQFGWEIKLLPSVPTKPMSIVDEFKRLCEKDVIIMGHLIDEYGVTNHYVAMTCNMICDSNFSRLMELNYSNLCLSCGSDEETRTFCTFENVIIYKGLESSK